MKNKTTIGLGLLAVAAAAAWYYWRQRTTTAATDNAATPDSPFNRTGQIGSNFTTDITPDLVALALDSSQKAIQDAQPCWEFSGTSEKDRSLELWTVRDSPSGQYGFFNSGTRPSGRICRGN